jgi:hypothetical protein
MEPEDGAQCQHQRGCDIGSPYAEKPICRTWSQSSPGAAAGNEHYRLEIVRSTIVFLGPKCGGTRASGIDVSGAPIEADAVVIAMGPWSMLAASWVHLPQLSRGERCGCDRRGLPAGGREHPCHRLLRSESAPARPCHCHAGAERDRSAVSERLSPELRTETSVLPPRHLRRPAAAKCRGARASTSPPAIASGVSSTRRQQVKPWPS